MSTQGFLKPISSVESAADDVVNAVKGTYSAAVNQVLQLIDTAQASLASMPLPAGASCGASSTLQQFEDALRAQLETINAATTVADLLQAQQDTIALLKENMDTISTSVADSVTCVYNATVNAEKAYLTTAKVQALSKKTKGEDVTALLSDIAAANELIAQSEAQYAVATTLQTKAIAFQTLAKTAPYIQSISGVISEPT